MKKILFVISLFCSFSLFSQTASGGKKTEGTDFNSYKKFFRFDVGYEDNEFMAHHGWRTHSVALELERSIGTTPFSTNYRVSVGLNDSNQFYMHMPVGPVAGVLLFFLASGNSNSCVNLSASALLFILPDGFGFNPIQKDNVQFGVYANIFGIDFCNSARRNTKGALMNVDYAPDFGMRFNYYLNEKTYTFARASAKYSTIFAGWGAQATVGIGFEFSRN